MSTEIASIRSGLPGQVEVVWDRVSPPNRWAGALVDVRFGSLADILTIPRHVRFTPNNGHSSVQAGCPKSANSGHCPPSTHQAVE